MADVGRHNQMSRPRLAAEVATRLLERLDGLRFEPKSIVDLGCGPGFEARRLAERFAEGRVVAVDRSTAALNAAAARRGRWRKRFERVRADARALPLADASVDLLFSSLTLPAIDDLPALVGCFRRVLRPGGLLLISTLGPDTLAELRPPDEPPGRLADVQTLGDLLLRSGFAEPVLDTDWITSEYRDGKDLVDELDALAVDIPPPGQLVEHPSGPIRCTWEVVYASCWAPPEGAPIRSFHGEEASVSVASIGRRKR